MSDNLPTEIEEPTTDLSPIDLEKINKFIEEGLPGIASIDDGSMARMMSLYLEGKPYTQIARILRVKKPLVLYLSNKFNWFQARKEYLYELESTIRNRVIEAKIVSQDFLLQLTYLWQKKIGNQISEYLRTGNEDFANKIDLKEVDRYIKTLDMLHKINSDGSKPTAPAVGLNLGDGVTIKKLGNNEVEVTPKNKTIGDMLKQFADFRRETTNESKENKENKGEKNE